jgi:hypothetical protein
MPPTPRTKVTRRGRPRTLARRAERRQRLALARDRLAAEDQARRDAQRAKVEAWDAAAPAGKRGGRRPGDEARTNRNNTEPRANNTDPDVRVMRNQKGYIAGYNGQLVVTCQQVIVGAMLSQHPVDRMLLHPLPGTCRQQLADAGISPRLRTVLADAGYVRRPSPAATPAGCGCWHRWPKTPAGTAPARRNGPGTWTSSRPPPLPGGGCSIRAAATTTRCGPAPWRG